MPIPTYRARLASTRKAFRPRGNDTVGE